LDSARTCLKIWNRVDRGRFTNRGQKNNEIGRVVPKLSTRLWSGFTADFDKKQPPFFENSSMAAGDDREACRNLCLSTQTLAANMLIFMCTASGTRRMIPIVHVNPPRNGGKDAPGGGLWTTYAHATAHLRCSSPYYMPNDCPRPPFYALRLRIREFSGPNLTPAPAASRVCTPITREILGGTGAPA
jgi:hypothetical protein